MLETHATVVATAGQSASVLLNQVSGCEQCNGQGCGSSKVAQLFCSKTVVFEVVNPVNAQVGDKVLITVQDGAVLRGISVLYLIPLSALVGTAALVNFLINDEFWVALGAILGLLLGFWCVKMISGRLKPKQPCIRRVV